MPKLSSKRSPLAKIFTPIYQKVRQVYAAFLRYYRSFPKLHRSFRRSYREDYARPLSVPNSLSYVMYTLRLILQNWRLFLPLLVFAVVFNVALVGIMSEETYVKFQDVLAENNAKIASGEIGNFAKAGLILISTVTTGGLSSGLSEVEIVFAVISFLLLWLITVYIARHRLAGHRIKLRDALYNALTPLISTFVVLVVAFLQAIPIVIIVITYSIAVQTDFLATPFYALVYFVFAASLSLLSVYLISGTFLALVAVTAPGTYPLAALRTSSSLLAGRRTHLIWRLTVMLFSLACLWVIFMLPTITLDLFFKAHFSFCAGWPLIPVCLLIMTCFSAIYISVYVYLCYRYLLNNKDKA